MTDILTLVLGALIGIVSVIIGYVANHLLSIREQKLVRDFEVREKGRDFFHQIYGTVTTLSDMVVPFRNEMNANEAVVLTEKGYVSLPKAEVISRYKIAYAKYAKLWYEAREKGLEIFLMKDFVTIMFNFWAYAGYFNEDNKNWENKEAIEKFEEIRNIYCDEMDKLMGLAEPRHIPKWLNPKKSNRMLRGEESD